jgi:hypothetical protein
MKLQPFILVLLLLVSAGSTENSWQPAGDRIRSAWAEEVNPGNVWNVYPRPLLVRSEWHNLNGLWKYSVSSRLTGKPDKYEGEILVPFPVESSLSGVMRKVGEDNVVWYERNFSVPAGWRGRDILLHFGAVDWQADVWINDIKVGSHTGGYTPFSFNITPFLNARGEQKLVVRVWDPTDKHFQPRGKQVSDPRSIWYTAVTGIWQTVWMEPVPGITLRA